MVKETIEKEKEEKVLEQFGEDVRVSDLEIRQDQEGNYYALGPDREKALELSIGDGQLKAEHAVLNVETTEKKSNAEGLEETEFHLEKKEADEEEGAKIVVVEPVTRGDEHLFL